MKEERKREKKEGSYSCNVLEDPLSSLSLASTTLTRDDDALVTLAVDEREIKGKKKEKQ